MGKKKKPKVARGPSINVKKWEDKYEQLEFQNPYDNLTNTLEGVENPYAQAQNQYAGMTNPYANLSNAYEGMGNVYSGMTNQFAGMENVFEGAQNQYADMKSQFEGMENEFAGMENQYANLKNQYAGMENQMEEIGISTEAADFAAEKQAQARADIMGALSGAAGGSGISGLAQTLANQASEDARASSADIAKQEVENEKARLQESTRIDMLQRGEASKLDQLRAGEQARIETLKAQGATDIDKLVRGERAEIDRIQRGEQARLVDRELQEKARLGTLSAQEAARIDQLQRGYEGDMDRLIRGEDARLDLLSAQGAYDLERLQRGEDARLQDQFLGTEMSLDLAQRGMAHELQMKGAEGDMYVQQLEMDRISTMLQGALGGAAASKQAAATRSAGRSSMTGQIVSTAITKITKKCIPKGTYIDTLEKPILIENLKPGDIVIGYDGAPVKVLQKHEYLEDPKSKRFYEVTIKDGDIKRKVNCCDQHRICGIKAIDLKENENIKIKIYNGVKFSYDLLTEDIGYRINGVPVNTMIPEMMKEFVKIEKIINKQH